MKKWLVIMILLAVLLLSGCGYQRGDVNRDGKVDVLDITALERIILGLEK